MCFGNEILSYTYNYVHLLFVVVFLNIELNKVVLEASDTFQQVLCLWLLLLLMMMMTMLMMVQ